MDNELFEESVKEELHNMETRLTELEGKIDAVDKKITQVVDAILGNPLTKTGGFMEDIMVLKNRITELEKEQLEYRNFKNKITWTVSLLMSLGALVGVVIQYFLNNYFKN